MAKENTSSMAKKETPGTARKETSLAIQGGILVAMVMDPFS